MPYITHDPLKPPNIAEKSNASVKILTKTWGIVVTALVQYVYYKSNGVILDLTSRAQSLNGKEVKRSELKRGDLMFFTNASRKNKVGIERIGHVGIYFGNNYILHTASDHAVIEPISNTRWGYYVTARRVV